MAQPTEQSNKTSKSRKQATPTDDELLDSCIKNSLICYDKNCSKSIKLIKLQCPHCAENFCTTHALPESHGCAELARKAAATAPRKQLKEEKKHELENKLGKKLEKMKNERKKKAK